MGTGAAARPRIVALCLLCAFVFPACQKTPAGPAVASRTSENYRSDALDLGDRFSDGTPDFLRLTNESDRRAFRGWFTLLAEAMYFRDARDLPAEVDDCAALLRFAYHEALRRHDAVFASEFAMPPAPAIPDVAKFSYPFTPLGASLFRVKDGAFRADDLRNGSFAQFADARTLRTYNTHLVGRDLRQARPGDLLFFRQLSQDMPFHAMIFVGRSPITGDGDWIVYHTGPIGRGAGEMRRVHIADLLRHPSPRWRPLPGNSNFLGIYRWNILREGD